MTATIKLAEIIARLSEGKHPDKIYVAREYTIADLRNDLLHAQEIIGADKPFLGDLYKESEAIG